jgi:hypothetical protein
MIARRELLVGMGAACGCALMGAPRAAASSLPASGSDQRRLICSGADSYHLVNAEVDFEPAPEAAAVIQRMAHGIGLDVPITVGKMRNVPGSAYAQRRRGELMIVYDQGEYDFKNGHISWSSLFVFAHELGHHVAHPHIRDGGSTHPKERAADRFAGAALARIGATTLDQVLTWPRTASEKGSTTHPPRAERIAAATAGWYEAQAQMRWQSAAGCKTDWMGEEVQIGGETCRIARRCGTHGSEIRLACQESSGRWVWMD